MTDNIGSIPKLGDPYHLRLWREQPVKGPAVKRTAGKALTADRSGNICVTFSDGVFQMKQGETQAFFLYIKKLAGPSADGY